MALAIRHVHDAGRPADRFMPRVRPRSRAAPSDGRRVFVAIEPGAAAASSHPAAARDVRPRPAARTPCSTTQRRSRCGPPSLSTCGYVEPCVPLVRSDRAVRTAARRCLPVLKAKAVRRTATCAPGYLGLVATRPAKAMKPKKRPSSTRRRASSFSSAASSESIRPEPASKSAPRSTNVSM
jgi:hypothetical protein